MIPHETFAAIVRALDRHGITGLKAETIADTIMDELDRETNLGAGGML